MSAYDNILMAACAVLLVYLPWRFFQLVRLKDRDRRFFYGFWIWPVLWFVLWNVVPVWAGRPWLYQVTVFFFIGGTVLDFVFYYVMRTQTNLKHQVLSGLLLLPCLLVVGRHWLVSDPLQLVVPYYGQTLIWTDHPLTPRSWYFMDPKSDSNKERTEKYEDPNFGKAVFSPITGKVVSIEGNQLNLRNDEVSISLSPLLPDSIRLKAGDEVLVQMPLGLLETSDGVPGLKLTVSGDRPVRFKDTYAGRWWAPLSENAVLRRNDKALSQAEGTFQVRPVTQ
ncbi:MAG: hypothetical protein QNK37_00900 [Acidobacteriota bacterium]|nr:hypothetical protein [Acidobacteriota bacterium]